VGKIIASSVVVKVIDTFNLNLENIALEIKNQGLFLIFNFTKKNLEKETDYKINLY